ncbi:uncharacterized protein LOC110728707 isoform X1 [Chenopodium quinoa]|uniref:uncharacterized protein LOC110728707 isoform X1 n=1 Tax=Chenopodium quinoa TaxID=63459 RepID=UPI000B77C512|nr:uncharacterized protein LOC110728707 isoform X1 [Chenopodium quinoa]
MLPADKTPAKSAAEIRKENAEKKLAAQAAKKDGSKVPHSVSKIIRPRTGEEPPAQNKARKTSSLTVPSRLTIGGKTLKNLGLGFDLSKRQPDVPEKETEPPRASGASIPAEGSHDPHPTTQGTLDPFNPSFLGKPMRVKSHSQLQPEDSSGSRQSIGGKYVAFSPSVSGADHSPRWPDVQRYARAMLKAVPKEEKEAIPGIHSFNADQVLAGLSESMLRVEGLKKAYARKCEEVRRAKRDASDAHNVAQYSMIMHELKTKSIIMQQADNIKRLQKVLDEAGTKIHNLKAEKDNAEAELKKVNDSSKLLEVARKENTNLLADNVRLKEAAAKASDNFKATLEAEQSRLIEENEQDCIARMQKASSLVHPDAEYTVWELAYKHADLAIDAQETNQLAPEPYEEWVQKQIEAMQERIERRLPLLSQEPPCRARNRISLLSLKLLVIFFGLRAVCFHCIFYRTGVRLTIEQSFKVC